MARIGMVNFINTAPIYEIWRERVARPDWQMIGAPPTTLNRLLAEDRLDLGFVSSYEYARRPERYQIMADLSISATGPVGSVFLFSKWDPRDLSGKQVLLTGQSDTSVCLVKIILEEFYQTRPEYQVGEVFSELEHVGRADAVLAIGDEALRLKLENRYPVQLDLGETWHKVTKLPFVFAVCAVREEFLQAEAQAAREIRQTLLDCREQGLAELPRICGVVAERIPMDRDACAAYLQSMEYDLGPAKRQALEKFFSYLIKRGEADSGALPLKIFS